MDAYDQHNTLDTVSMLVVCGLAIFLIGYVTWKSYEMYALLNTQKASNAQLDNQKQKPPSTKVQPYHTLASENYLFGKAEATFH